MGGCAVDINPPECCLIADYLGCALLVTRCGETMHSGVDVNNTPIHDKSIEQHGTLKPMIRRLFLCFGIDMLLNKLLCISRVVRHAQVKVQVSERSITSSQWHCSVHPIVWHPNAAAIFKQFISQKINAIWQHVAFLSSSLSVILSNSTFFLPLKFCTMSSVSNRCLWSFIMAMVVFVFVLFCFIRKISKDCF